MKTINIKAVEKSEMIEQSIKFWFADKKHLRSPFPAYIQPELRRLAKKTFLDWLMQIKSRAEKEINDIIMVEKFEELLFEQALRLVKTEDEKITINFPFLPRINDEVSTPKKKEKSTVVDRSIVKEGDLVFLSLKMKNNNNDCSWESRIELPKIGF